MLIATYIVLFIIIVVASAFFTLLIYERKNIERGNEGLKALNFAEKGIAYAYQEAYSGGWTWYTHEWKNLQKDELVALKPQEQSKIRTDCFFDANGFYAANNGEFMVKAYPDRTRDNDTLVLSMGRSGTETRVVLYYLTRRGMYDFFCYTPYDLNLYSAVGHYADLNGGGIHANGNIYISSYMRLEDISELSTGEDGVIYYASSQYAAPFYPDRYDGDGVCNGGDMDGEAPIQRLDNPTYGWRDDSKGEPGPFGYYDTYGRWQWNSYANHFENLWDSSFLNADQHFYGSSDPNYNVAPGAKDPWTSARNNSDNPLNRYNCWIKPYITDKDNQQSHEDWAEIPAELDQQWDWSKYFHNNASEQPVTFYTYDDDGKKVPVSDSWWEIDSNTNVVMLNPPQDPEEKRQFFADHPNAKTYWDMYQDPAYWTATGRTGYEKMVDPNLFDGIYGDERLSGGTIPVKFTNSMKQPEAWKDFLQDSGLSGIIRDGNTGGEYLETPDFTVTYSRFAKKDGLYLGLVGEHEDDEDWQEKVDYNQWQQVLEDSIDAHVESLNTAGGSDAIAKKVSFINTFTGRRNVMLEIDLDLMGKKGITPNNGIVYTKVPVRLVDAQRLPRKQANYGFTVLGEENVYLKGDYNTAEWVTSAVISKKRVFTLSDDFNDPQVIPAPCHYPNYPYLYVKDDGGGNHVEVPYDSGNPNAGMWVHINNLDTDGAIDTVDIYPTIDDANELVLRQIISQKDAAYQPMFNNVGTATATFKWTPSGESYTFGMMPNRVTKDQNYNCLIASRRWLDNYQSNKGDVLENWRYYDEISNSWQTRYRNLNGAYFVLDNEGFTASNFIDYTGVLGYDNRQRQAPSSILWNSYYLFDYNARENIAYDENFRTATRSPSDVFFGGAESLWSEATMDFFYQMDF